MNLNVVLTALVIVSAVGVAAGLAAVGLMSRIRRLNALADLRATSEPFLDALMETIRPQFDRRAAHPEAGPTGGGPACPPVSPPDPADGVLDAVAAGRYAGPLAAAGFKPYSTTGQPENRGTWLTYLRTGSVVVRVTDAAGSPAAMKIYHAPAAAIGEALTPLKQALSGDAVLSKAVVLGEFFPGGLILADGRTRDVRVMPWIDGYTLADFVRGARKQPDGPEWIAAVAVVMADVIQRAWHRGLTFLDIASDNVLVLPGQIRDAVRFVDADSLSLPGVTGWSDRTTGQRGFQPPARLSDPRAFDLYRESVDAFSVLVVLLSLMAYAVLNEAALASPELGDEQLVLDETDLRWPGDSPRWRLLTAAFAGTAAEAPLEQLRAMLDPALKPADFPRTADVTAWATEDNLQAMLDAVHLRHEGARS